MRVYVYILVLISVFPSLLMGNEYNEAISIKKEHLLKKENWNYTSSQERKSDSLYSSIIADIEAGYDASVFRENILWAKKDNLEEKGKLPIWWEKALVQLSYDIGIDEDYRQNALRQLWIHNKEKYLADIFFMSNDPSRKVRKYVAQIAFRKKNIGLTTSLIIELNSGDSVFFIERLKGNNEMRELLESLISKEPDVFNFLYLLKIHTKEFADQNYLLSQISLIKEKFSISSEDSAAVHIKIKEIEKLTEPKRAASNYKYEFPVDSLPIANIEEGMKAIQEERKDSLRIKREKFIEDSIKWSKKYQFKM